jgi:hypothetical protein
VPRTYAPPPKILPDPRRQPENTKQALLGAVALIKWSGLATGTTDGLTAETDCDRFNAHWKKKISHHGRWLCWIAFGVGAEGIVSAAFYMKGSVPKKFGDYHKWEVLGLNPGEIQNVKDPIRHLSDVRNRDAHWYEANVRNEEFQYVESEYVPALNLILDAVRVSN